LLSQKGDNTDIFGVKVAVKKRGCTGYSYVMNYSKKNEIDKFDEIVDVNGVKIIID
jgi:Fe-S cluster assembly iron-binding protein IscA